MTTGMAKRSASSSVPEAVDPMHVRLSGKEVAGLPARIFAAAEMPWGAVGGAAEVVEFLELSGQRGLTRAADDIAGFGPGSWRSAAFEALAPGRLVYRADRSSAHFFGTSLACWLDAAVRQAGSAIAVVLDAADSYAMTAVPWRLSQRGATSLAVGLGPDDGVLLAAGHVGEDGWTYSHARVAMARTAEPWTGIDVAAMRSRQLEAASDALVDLVAGSKLDLVAAGDPGPSREARPLVWLVIASHGASRGADLENAARRVASAGPSGPLTAAGLAALKRSVREKGWPMQRALWERSMSFADRALIASSEPSRKGAG